MPGKAYASALDLKLACVDPRFNLVARKTAEFVEWLGIPDNPGGKGWAGSAGYGAKIFEHLNAIIGIKVPANKNTVKFRIDERLFDIPSFNMDGRNFVGARELLERMGYEVGWDGH